MKAGARSVPMAFVEKEATNKDYLVRTSQLLRTSVRRLVSATGIVNQTMLCRTVAFRSRYCNTLDNE